MTETNLLEEVIQSLPVKQIHPLHRAILEECCEKVESGDNDLADRQTKVYAVQMAFLTCESVVRSTITSLVQEFDADILNLNYRGQTFEISKGSPFWS